MSEKSKVELLAPAGNPQAFYGALNAGADAVYLAALVQEHMPIIFPRKNYWLVCVTLIYFKKRSISP